jgi:hypothetical protein
MTEGIASLPSRGTEADYVAKRAARLEELTGAEGAIAERKEAEARRRELAESQYTPEKERSRLLRATLAGLGRGGLGGLSAGYAQEEGRIFGERTAESERSVQEMDKIVAELRAMGLSQFEAENVAVDQFQNKERNEQQRIQQLEEAKDRRFNQIMSLVQGFSQLDNNMQNRMGAAILDATEDVALNLSMVNRALADPKTRGDDRKRFEAQRASLQQDMDDTVRRVTVSFGESMDYRPIVAELLRSAMPAGVGATATTISPDTLADLERYGN